MSFVVTPEWVVCTPHAHMRPDTRLCTASVQVNAKLLVAFTRVDRYGLALSYFEPVFSAIEKHCEMQASSPGELSST